jgi:RNA polymerase sigma-B factor
MTVRGRDEWRFDEATPDAAFDRTSRDQLVLEHLPLARHFARRYRYTSEPLDDLVQVATAALVMAVDRFDPSRDVRFATYASRVIVGELKRYLRDRTWSVHVPRRLQERSLAVRAAVEELRGALRRSPTVAEVAEHLGLGLEEVLEAMDVAAAYRPHSIDRPRSVSGREGVEIPTIEDGYASVEERHERTRVLRSLLTRLDERDRTLVRLYFLEGLSQDEVARRAGISQVSVSRHLRRIIGRLRTIAHYTSES